MSIGTFQIKVPQHTLDDLQARLTQTRWSDEIDDGWTFGTDRTELTTNPVDVSRLGEPIW